VKKRVLIAIVWVVLLQAPSMDAFRRRGYIKPTHKRETLQNYSLAQQMDVPNQVPPEQVMVPVATTQLESHAIDQTPLAPSSARTSLPQSQRNVVVPADQNMIDQDASEQDEPEQEYVEEDYEEDFVDESHGLEEEIIEQGVRYEQEQEDLPAPVSLGAHDFDEGAKKKQVQALIQKAVAYFNSHTADESFSAFNHQQDFIKGELYLFVFDTKGVCMAHGQQNELIWQNMYNTKDTYGIPFVQHIIDRGRMGGGWITYQWKNAAKISYVTEVRKEDKSYIIGCGFYPHSKPDAVVTLVKGAVALFNDIVKQGRSKDEAFSSLSYTLGRFVFGDLYLYALDFNGLQYAHGELPGVIGTNAWTYRDAAGKLVNQEIIAKLKDVDPGTGIWVSYISKNAPKKAYAEKVMDETGKPYFIACGYYPDADRRQAENLVKRGYRYMKGNGKTQAARAFTDKGDDAFRYGDLYLVVYDLRGVCIAHGSNASLVGKNLYDVQDEDGMYYVREIIKKALSGGGWIDYKEKNSFKSTYIEKINLGIEEFVITCGLYPISKREVMIQLAKTGADYLKTHEPEEALRDFVKLNGKFIRGDLGVFVFDNRGIILADGNDYDIIWRNLMQAKDDAGKPYVRTIVNTVAKGAGSVSYRIHGATRITYLEPVQKAGKLYIVGSGYYL
jgi:signal transduction histidine kinase